MIRSIGTSLLLLAAVAATASTIGAAVPSPTQVTITMTGTERPNPNATGNFTAAAPLCTAGTFTEQDNSLGVGIETLTCADGSGTITLKTPADWIVIGGTGNYVKLVGQGSCLVNPTPSGGFIRSCTGSVGFDDKPPALSGEKLSASRLPKAASPTYLVQVVFVATDDTGVQSYKLAVLSGKRRLAATSGSPQSVRTALHLRVRPPAGARSLIVQLTLTDSYGNTATTAKTFALK